MNIYVELLIISAIVSLIYGTGFFEELDNWISGKWKFVHLPKIVMCSNCATWWLCLLYILITGNMHLVTILFCICMWYISPIFSNFMYICIDFLNKMLDKIRN